LRNHSVGNTCKGARNQDVVGRRLGVLDHDVEETVSGERAGVGHLVFRLLTAAARVFRAQILVRKGPLRITVERLHVGVRGQVVEVEPHLLDVLAVVAFVPVQPVQALFDDAVAAVPERRCEAQALVVVADPHDAVFAPAVRP
jgi:hypothetical protein